MTIARIVGILLIAAGVAGVAAQLRMAPSTLHRAWQGEPCSIAEWIWAQRLVAARRDLPITPGLMPVTNFRQIQRMSELMGTPLPPAVVGRLEAGHRHGLQA